MQSYAEVIDAKFRYPLTGLVYVEFDSELFPNQIPNISIKKKWKLINVPTNYDPITRTYSGTWNGLWKKAWSNNPAFVLYDLITNQRYGLDQRELGIEIDKWSIYECAQYCDQMVPNGKGGTEPRYLCDVVIQSRVEAYQLIRDICSIFRGMSFWNGESLSIVIDKPRQPSYIFSNENVIGGEFTYTFASEKSMYTQCNVTFDDAQNFYSQDIEGVFDPEMTLRFGHNPTAITAIGCTRRSEANRRGRWVLKTNVRSTTVNFATGTEGMIPTIGDVIIVADNFWSSALTMNLSGRVMEVSGLQVFLPFKVDARPGDRIIVNKPDGAPVGRTIANVTPDGKTITINTTFGFDVQPDAIFAIERTDLAQQQYVVTEIKRGDGEEEFSYSITAVEYDPNKYDEIDYGVNIDDRPTSIVQPDILPAPQNVKVSSYSRIVQGMSVETMRVTRGRVCDSIRTMAGWQLEQHSADGERNGSRRYLRRKLSCEGSFCCVEWFKFWMVCNRECSPFRQGWTKRTDKHDRHRSFGIRVKWGMPDGSGDTAYIELHQHPTDRTDTRSKRRAFRTHNMSIGTAFQQDKSGTRQELLTESATFQLGLLLFALPLIQVSRIISRWILRTQKGINSKITLTPRTKHMQQQRLPLKTHLMIRMFVSSERMGSSQRRLKSLNLLQMRQKRVLLKCLNWKLILTAKLTPKTANERLLRLVTKHAVQLMILERRETIFRGKPRRLLQKQKRVLRRILRYLPALARRLSRSFPGLPRVLARSWPIQRTGIRWDGVVTCWRWHWRVANAFLRRSVCNHQQRTGWSVYASFVVENNRVYQQPVSRWNHHNGEDCTANQLHKLERIGWMDDGGMHSKLQGVYMQAELLHSTELITRLLTVTDQSHCWWRLYYSWNMVKDGAKAPIHVWKNCWYWQYYISFWRSTAYVVVSVNSISFGSYVSIIHINTVVSYIVVSAYISVSHPVVALYKLITYALISGASIYRSVIYKRLFNCSKCYLSSTVYHCDPIASNRRCIVKYNKIHCHRACYIIHSCITKTSYSYICPVKSN
ncbi:host specificity protein J [Salmonella virus STSR3]|nr:host specificity protein J [Salmonella virus STSR3]